MTSAGLHSQLESHGPPGTLSRGAAPRGCTARRGRGGVDTGCKQRQSPPCTVLPSAPPQPPAQPVPVGPGRGVREPKLSQGGLSAGTGRRHQCPVTASAQAGGDSGGRCEGSGPGREGARRQVLAAQADLGPRRWATGGTAARRWVYFRGRAARAHNEAARFPAFRALLTRYERSKARVTGLLLPGNT